MAQRDDARAKLIAAAKEAVAKNGGYLLRDQFVRQTGINTSQIYRAFPEGGFTELLRLADIPDHPEHQKRRPVATDELLEEVHRVFLELQRVPTRTLYDAHSKVSSGTTEKRFGSWSKALAAYLEWLEVNDPAVPWASELRIRLRTEQSSAAEAATATAGRIPVDEFDKIADRFTYGELLNFRGLQHASINEQGVVYLFGVVSHELEFLIEAVQTGFPDCHGKRRVKGNRWHPVRLGPRLRTYSLVPAFR